MILQDGAATELALIAPRLVGATFIWAGAIKAIEPFVFADHLYALGWIPNKLVMRAVTAAAALEAGLGTALLLGSAPSIILPLTVIVLVALSIASWWGVKSGRTNDCGCYGGYISPSIGQSLAINGLFVLFAIAGWSVARPQSGYSAWHLVTPIMTMIAAAGFTEIVVRHRIKTGKPMFDLNPLKSGRRFKHSWAGGLTVNTRGEVIVAFLGPECPHCVKFVKVGNAMVQSPLLPRVVGVVAASKPPLDSFIEEKGIRFPMATLSPSTFWRLAPAVPTAVLVDSGTIKRVWTGGMPPDFVDRFKDAFFPATEAPAPAPEAENVNAGG